MSHYRASGRYARERGRRWKPDPCLRRAWFGKWRLGNMKNRNKIPVSLRHLECGTGGEVDGWRWLLELAASLSHMCVLITALCYLPPQPFPGSFAVPEPPPRTVQSVHPRSALSRLRSAWEGSLDECALRYKIIPKAHRRCWHFVPCLLLVRAKRKNAGDNT